jgi:hypothetical protein
VGLHFRWVGLHFGTISVTWEVPNLVPSSVPHTTLAPRNLKTFLIFRVFPEWGTIFLKRDVPGLVTFTRENAHIWILIHYMGHNLGEGGQNRYIRLEAVHGFHLVLPFQSHSVHFYVLLMAMSNPNGSRDTDLQPEWRVPSPNLGLPNGSPGGLEALILVIGWVQMDLQSQWQQSYQRSMLHFRILTAHKWTSNPNGRHISLIYIDKISLQSEWKAHFVDSYRQNEPPIQMEGAFH